MSSNAERCKRAQQKKRAILNGLKNVPCMDCGKRFPPECMDFDHVRGIKIKDVGTMTCTAGLDKIMDEVAKCDVVCANCHRIRTQQRQKGSTWSHRDSLQK